MSLPADELLSAFHDGEVPLVERAVVGQQLSTSRESRRELSEIQQIASLLKELPRETLPSDFSRQVLSGLEREMLIPSDRMTSTPSRTRFGSFWFNSSSRRRWLVSAAGTLASAACLMLLLQVLRQDTQSVAQRNQRLAGVADVESVDTLFGSATSSTPMAGDADVSLNSSRPMSASAVPNAPPLAKSAEPNSSPRLSKRAAGSDKSGDVGFDIPRLGESQNLFFDQQALKFAEIGDVVEAVRTEGDEVAVVKLTVVDRQEGIEQLQLLLTKNQIDRDDSRDTMQRMEKKKIATDSQRPLRTDDVATVSTDVQPMLAVFVESDARRMTAVLNQLRETDFLQSLEVSPPIALAALDDVNQNGKSLSELQAQSPRVRLPEKAAGRDDLKSRTKTDSASSVSRQYALQLPASSLPQFPMPEVLRNQNRLNRSSTPGPAVTTKTDNGAANDRPMQVLFVLVDEVFAGKPVESKPFAPAKSNKSPAKPSNQDGAHRRQSSFSSQPA